MSELINKHDNRTTIRWKLLTGVSALALTAYVSSAGVVRAEDADHPLLWIELGGQAERLENSQEPFLPPFAMQAPAAIRAPMVTAQRPPLYSFGEEGKISFTPENSDWLFAISVLYGRASTTKHSHYETDEPKAPLLAFGRTFPLATNLFGDGKASASETHLILDFQVGRDVGLGMFGNEGSSVITAGVRFVQFTSQSQATLRGRGGYVSGPFFTRTHPATAFYAAYTNRWHSAYFHDYTGLAQSRRTSHSVGPAVSWHGSVPFAGKASEMELTLDLGVNAAVLFGRQRVRVHHQTSGSYEYRCGPCTYGSPVSHYARNPADQNRSRSVTIPNAGGFAGISLKFPNAKISIGYRGDFFVGAMDTGIDERKSATLGFYGPFASISVGLGD